jgi:hypothetical protein
MAYKGIYGVLYRFCAGCACDDLDPYSSELWYGISFGPEGGLIYSPSSELLDLCGTTV